MKHEEHIKWLIDTLYSWNTTFEDENSEEELPLTKLIKKIKTKGINQLTKKEIDNIFFHLFQKFN